MRDEYRTAFLAAIPFFLIFASIVCGQPEISLQSNFIYHMDQNVKGNGFFNAYQNSGVTNLSLSNTAHGSGSYNHELKLDSRNGIKFDTDRDEYTTSSDRGTVMTESTDFSYSPSMTRLGKYSRPIAFQSKGAEETCLRNFISGTSMNAMLNYADTISKNLSAELYWRYTNATDEFTSNLMGQTKTDLNLEASFSGSGHIGVLDASQVGKNPKILIDEDYRGTYYLIKNMSQEAEYKLTRQKDDWLPCCSGGFADMNVLDQKPIKSATGIFDCTCLKAPNKAEFQWTY